MDITKAQLMQAVADGLTQPEAGERLGCSKWTIRRRARKHGIVWPKRGGFEPQQYAVIGDEILSFPEIARRNNLHPSTVRLRWNNGLRGEDLAAPPAHDTRAPEEYETPYSERDWQVIVDLAEQRGIKHAAYTFGVPYGAITAAMRGEEHRLG